MPTASRVILAGPTGVEKAEAANKLKAWLERETGLKNRVGVHDVERALRETDGGDPRSLAGVRSARAQRERWRKAWTFINREIERAGDICSIITLHLVFAQRGHRICPAPLTSLADWNPDLVVTLIDDVYACKRRIELKGYRFSFAQLYDWRTTEVMLADQVAYIRSAGQVPARGNTHDFHARCESVVLPVKHPLITLGRLISNPNSPRAYASFPITSTRGNDARRAEIDRFRTRMHQVLTTFDPVAIDELPLLIRGGARGQAIRSFHPVLDDMGARKDLADQRWEARISQDPNSDLAPLVCEPDQAANHVGKTRPFYPLVFAESEIEELWKGEAGEETSVAHDHVTVRDIRFVDQADFVVCYRPYWGGRITTGVGAEIHHANETGKPVYAFVGGDTRPAKPLEGFFTQQFTNESDFWAFLEQQARRTVSVPRPMYF